jgi:CRP/FNR family transcriptional regulator, cyclic AMP receptor protein
MRLNLARAGFPMAERRKKGLYSQFIRSFGESETVFEEGASGFEMYIVFSGRVRIHTRRQGKDITLGVIEPGQFFGEMAICDSAPRTATATAIEKNTRLIVLDQDKFLYLISQQPAFALTIMQSLCQRIRDRWSLLDKCLESGSGKGISSTT